MNYELHCGDCRDILPMLKGIDAVVTDPPFGIDFAYATHDDTPEGYGEWLWQILQEAERLCRPGAPIFVWQAMLNARQFSEWFPRDYRIFAACKNFVQMRPTAMQYAFDPVIVWWTDGEKYSEGTLNRDWFVGNTANTLNRKDGDSRGHPCARPLNQMKHIVNQWVRPGGTVLDPFMGSGTTGVACIQTGRNFIGIEIDPSYFAIASKRIAEAQMQPLLLGAP